MANEAECLNKLKGAKEAVEFLLEDEDSFSEQAGVLFAIGRYSARERFRESEGFCPTGNQAGREIPG